jgi:hypothetical protein
MKSCETTFRFNVAEDAKTDREAEITSKLMDDYCRFFTISGMGQGKSEAEFNKLVKIWNKLYLQNILICRHQKLCI